MDQAIHPIDDCCEILRTRGWVFRESAANDPNHPEYWNIDCMSGNKSFAILAPVRSEAWNLAVREVLRIHADQ